MEMNEKEDKYSLFFKNYKLYAKTIFFWFSFVIVVYSNFYLIEYVYNSVYKDERIEVLSVNDDEIASYAELLKHNSLPAQRNSLVLINNGHTKDWILKTGCPYLYERCKTKKWNLVYLSNEFGDTKYNRSRPNWFNNICEQKMYGFHLYFPDEFDIFNQYFSSKHFIPFGFVINEDKVIQDTLYYGDLQKLEVVIDQ